MSGVFDVRGLRVTRYPEPATRADYDEAARELEHACRSLPGLVGIYRAGGLSAPGISDLDFVIVIDRPHPVPTVWSQLSPATRHLAMHTPMLTHVGVFKRHGWIASLDPLQLVAGEATPAEPPPYPDYADLLVAAEGALSTQLRLLRALIAGRLKARPLLCELHSLRLDLQLARLSRSDAPLAWAFADEVARVRAAWFEEPQPGSALRALVQMAVPALREALMGIALRASEVIRGNWSQQVTLAGVWRNVTLAPGAGVEADVRALVPRAIGVLGARTAELRCRSSQVRLELPGQFLHLLFATPAGPLGAYREDRRKLIADQRNFLRQTVGYSSIGFGSSFAP